ncbi:hypothetical protein SDC9_184978 [bioreactor metagenome]|uniref:Uncharacterized protein n=1 Tax=bioreactor metagenome TaxID=1076179 RepID=A0A645HGZ4_9ZZZZ
MHGRGQHQRRYAHQRERRQVLVRVVGHARVDQVGDGEVAIDEQADGVIVPRLGHVVRANVSARAYLVFHNHRLPQHLGQRIGECASRQVRRRATRKAHDDAHRLVRPAWGGGCCCRCCCGCRRCERDAAGGCQRQCQGATAGHHLGLGHENSFFRLHAVLSMVQHQNKSAQV